MRDTFKQAFDALMEHEGGFVHDPDDPGGATNHGISLRQLIAEGEIDLDGDGFHDFDFDKDGDVDWIDVKNLTITDAEDYYFEFWWKRFHFEKFPPIIGLKMFDLAVNMGSLQAFKLLQRAIRACGQDLEDDGIFGPKTEQAMLAYGNDYRIIQYTLRSEAAGFYRALTAAKPIFNKYINGWLRRAYS